MKIYNGSTSIFDCCLTNKKLGLERLKTAATKIPKEYQELGERYVMYEFPVDSDLTEVGVMNRETKMIAFSVNGQVTIVKKDDV